MSQHKNQSRTFPLLTGTEMRLPTYKHDVQEQDITHPAYSKVLSMSRPTQEQFALRSVMDESLLLSTTRSLQLQSSSSQTMVTSPARNAFFQMLSPETSQKSTIKNATYEHPVTKHDLHSLNSRRPFGMRPVSLADTQASFLAGHSPQGTKRSLNAHLGGRPRKEAEKLKRPRYSPRENPTKLRRNRIVTTFVSADAWSHIFAFTDPKTLLELRYTCKTFHDILARESLWKECRINMLGEDCPPPPEGLRESRYMDLLVGQGCMGCGSPKVRKPQWAFWRRYCWRCFKAKTFKTADAQSVVAKCPDLLFCIARGQGSSTHPYTGVAADFAESAINGQFNQFNASQLRQNVFLRTDLTEIVQAFSAMELQVSEAKSDKTSEEMMSDWRLLKRTLTEKQMDHARNAEYFVIDLTEPGLNYRYIRAEFFRHKAEHMTPPLTADALQRIPAYQSALKICRLPTQRNWEWLRVKIEEQREAAEEQALSVRISRECNRSSEYRIAQDCRESLLPILSIFAHDACRELSDDGVADEDYVYLVLRRVYEKYYNTPIGARPKASFADLVKDFDDKYLLCMDDALKIFNSHIEPHLEYWSTERRAGAVVFRCPGCTRTDYLRLYRFEDLFSHIVQKHASTLGSDWEAYYQAGVEFGRIGMFAWHAVPWPRNLPMLAPHHKATGRWNPDEEHYERAPVISEEDAATIPYSAFQGRAARIYRCDDEQKLPCSILRVAHMFKDSALAPRFKTQIAWKYAVDQDRLNETKTVPLRRDVSVLENLSLVLIRNGEYSILDKLGCKSCADNDGRFTARFSACVHSFGELIVHFKQDHFSVDIKDWRTEMLLLPSDIALARALAQPGMETARAAFDELFPLIADAAVEDSVGVTATDGKTGTSALDVLAASAAHVDTRNMGLELPVPPNNQWG